ncbi:MULTISPECIES: lycopene cyclase domain-containing protein [unclassified Microbacterium]|uniref:lycopene cyclase domain-containing protein n=1 Tax=unclassified Microbacterium TaxID=2609290 RepID=UPI0038672292
MFAYSLLNAVFLLIVAALVVVARIRRPDVVGSRAYAVACAVTLGVLFVDTLIFDNILIAIGIVDYDPSRILGLRLGIAPIEDFGYSLAAGLGLPALWALVTPRPDADGRR